MKHCLPGDDGPGRVVATVLMVIVARGLLAQVPQARLDSLFPLGIDPGSAREIRVAGTFLERPTGLWFSDPRIHARQVEGAPDRFLVTVPPDVPPGWVDVRFSGLHGLSNPRVLGVDPRPGLAVEPTNTSMSTAVSLPLEMPATVRVQANASAWFRFRVRSGQRVLARIETAELDTRLIPVLAVHDAAGRERHRVRRMSLLDFRAPDDGDYFLQIHDATFRGGDDFGCRVVLTEGPHIDRVLPAVLQSGATNRVRLLGRNLPGGRPSHLTGLDGGPIEELEVEIGVPQGASDSAEAGEGRVFARRASASSVDLWLWRLQTASGRSNPAWFAVGADPVAVAGGGHARIQPPCQVGGMFASPGGSGGVIFEGRKGEVWWVEVIAERFGRTVDAHVVVERKVVESGAEAWVDVVELADGEGNLGGQEINTASRDPVGRLSLPEDGTYRVQVRDLFGSGRGRLPESYVLRLSRETPDFRLLAWSQPPARVNNDDRNVHPASVFLRRGQTWPVRVGVFRQHGFSGEIALTASNLPPGVIAHAGCRIAAGQSSGMLLLTAAGEAPRAGVTMEVWGHATAEAGRTLARRASAGSVVFHVPDFNNEYALSRPTRGLGLGVAEAEEAPVEVRPVESKTWEVAPGGRLSVPLDVIRRGEFQGAFTLKAWGHTALEKLKETPVPERTNRVVVEIPIPEAPLPVGEHLVWFQGQLAGKLRPPPPWIQELEAELKAADGEIQAASEALKAAPEAARKEIEARRNRAQEKKKAVEERLKLRDVTLGIYSVPVRVRVVAAPATKAG